MIKQYNTTKQQAKLWYLVTAYDTWHDIYDIQSYPTGSRYVSFVFMYSTF